MWVGPNAGILPRHGGARLARRFGRRRRRGAHAGGRVDRTVPEVTKVGIVGHADRFEDDPDALARSRAQAVSDFLIKKGVAADRLELESEAAGQPRTSGRSAADRAKNRRVGFVVLARKP